MASIILPRTFKGQPTGIPTPDPRNSISEGFQMGWMAHDAMFFGPNLHGQRGWMTNPAWRHDPRYGLAMARRDNFGAALAQQSLLNGMGYGQDFTLMVIARPTDTVSAGSYLATMSQVSNGVAAGIECGDGTKRAYRGRLYIGGTKFIGGSFNIPDDRPAAVTALRQRYNVEQALFVNGVKDPVVGNYTGQHIALGWFGNYGTGRLTEIWAIYAWRRALSDHEIALLAEDPYCFFLNDKRNVIISASTPEGFIYVPVSGSSFASASTSAKSQAVTNSSGNSNGSALVNATAVTVFNVVANSYGSASTGATAFTVKQTAASSSGSASASSVAVTVACANGSSQGSATVSGNAACVWHVSGSAAGYATVSAVSAFEGLTYVDTSGISYGSSTASAIARAVANASGAATGTATVTASAQALTDAIGSALGYANANGSGAMVITTTGAAVAASIAQANAQAVASAAGTAAGASSVQSVVITIHETVASSLSVSEVRAIAESVFETLGNSYGSATVIGKTDGGVHYTAVGDKFSISIVLSAYKVVIEGKQYDISLQPKPYKIELK